MRHQRPLPGSPLSPTQSDPTHPRVTLLRMDHTDSFFTRGFEAISNGLLEVTNYTSAHLGPQQMTRHQVARARRQVRALEALVRRLILLLALSLTLGPLRPRGARRPLPEGSVLLRWASPCSFTLLRPAPGSAFPAGADFARKAPPEGLVSTAALRRRMGLLYHLLMAPQTRAKSLARTLERQRRADDAPAICLGPVSGERLNPALSRLANTLPEQVRTALKSWDTAP